MSGTDTLSEDTFFRISELMHGSIGLCLPPAKKALVASRLGPRIQRLGLDSFDEYLTLIDGAAQPDEFQMAVDLLTTNETYFLREPAHFSVLERELAVRPGEPVSVWSAACSYGDEPYSIAMLLAEMQRVQRIGADWSVLGTDVSDRVLRAAADGLYPQERLRDVPRPWLRRYALRGLGDFDGYSLIKPELAERVRFGQLNLCEPLDVPGPFHAIFLRNVMIYFDNTTKTDVVDRLLRLLRPGGLFFIGMAERLPACATRLEPLGQGAFRKPAA
jgi:chemotaxis protein methyltransferase CheR